MSITAMNQALEALKRFEGEYAWVSSCDDAITALRTAIEQAESMEPFGYFQYAPHFDAWVQNRDSNEGVAFYTTPPAARREWVGLTDEQINQYDYEYRDILYDVEKMLRENNA